MCCNSLSTVYLEFYDMLTHFFLLFCDYASQCYGVITALERTLAEIIRVQISLKSPSDVKTLRGHIYGLGHTHDNLTTVLRPCFSCQVRPEARDRSTGPAATCILLHPVRIWYVTQNTKHCIRKYRYTPSKTTFYLIYLT